MLKKKKCYLLINAKDWWRGTTYSPFCFKKKAKVCFMCVCNIVRNIEEKKHFSRKGKNWPPSWLKTSGFSSYLIFNDLIRYELEYFEWMMYLKGWSLLRNWWENWTYLTKIVVWVWLPPFNNGNISIASVMVSPQLRLQRILMENSLHERVTIYTVHYSVNTCVF